MADVFGKKEDLHPSGSFTRALDPVQSLCEAHAELMDEGDDHRALALIPQITGLLGQGREDLIWAAANRVHATTGRADGFLDFVRQGACSVTQGGQTRTLFSIPISMGSRPRSDVRQGCAGIIADHLWGARLLGPQDGLQIAPMLVRHDLLSQWGPADLHALKCSMDSEDWMTRCEAHLCADAQHGAVWSAEVMGRPVHLYWLVGLCSHSSGCAPDWLSNSREGGFAEFMDAASLDLSTRFGVDVEVGHPGALAKHMRDGAFDQAAEGIMNASFAARQKKLANHLFCVRLFSLDDSPVGQILPAGPLSVRSKTRMRVEMTHASNPHALLCRYEFSCSTLDAPNGMADLVQILREHAGILDFERVSHDEAGNSVAFDHLTDESDVFQEDELLLLSRVTESGTHRPFLH